MGSGRRLPGVIPAAALVIGLVGVPAEAGGQEAAGLKFLGGLAYEPGGPGAALEEELAAAGYDGTPIGVCTDCEEYPFYHDEGLDLALSFGLRYRFVAPFAIEGLISNGQRGHAEGLASDGRTHLLISYQTLIVAMTVGAYLGPLRVAVGPGLNRVGWVVTRDANEAGRGATVTPGGSAELALDFQAGETLVTVKAGMRQFARADLSRAVDLPFRVDYRSFYLGCTLAPWH